MCGIFGAIATKRSKIDPARVTVLAMLNEQRGKHSTGFSVYQRSGKAKILRVAKRAAEVVDSEKYQALAPHMLTARSVLGHCRFATRGGHTEANAHPFTFNGKRGKVIGVHNGMIDAPSRYDVDSQYIFDRLSRYSIQGAMRKLSGNWGLAWQHGGRVFLHRQGAPLHVAIVPGGCVYFSSDKRHLRTACPDAEYMQELPALHVWEFDKHGNCTDRGPIEHEGNDQSFARILKDRQSKHAESVIEHLKRGKNRGKFTSKPAKPRTSEPFVPDSKGKPKRKRGGKRGGELIADRGVIFDGGSADRDNSGTSLMSQEEILRAYQDYESEADKSTLRNMLDDMDFHGYEIGGEG